MPFSREEKRRGEEEKGRERGGEEDIENLFARASRQLGGAWRERQNGWSEVRPLIAYGIESGK